MEDWIFGIPTPAALALVALIGYVIGKKTPRNVSVGEAYARRELKRAKAIVQQLEEISREVRRNLASHQSSIAHFKERIVLMSSETDHSGESWQTLCEEAERMLSPTMRLSAQIANAYDEVRQQANLLMTFTESRTDPLTGLSNRRALDDSLESLFAMKERYELTFSLCILDVDHFKKINDEYGHLEGDRVLQEVATLIDTCVRETDVVTRYGGEEFVILMPSTDLAGGMIFAERVRAAVEDRLKVTLSGGVAQASASDEPQTLIARADAALYRAKSNGRNSIYCHTGTGVQANPLPEQTQAVISHEDEENLLEEVRSLERSLGQRLSDKSAAVEEPHAETV
ncbi:GGDEF domain-containing protein [Bremerella sp. T1]|uniref:GGDEF domain-containing protein n=1 Tax=Bremerella sp. TYQ1 TaxID=3119568 RepID=UPI001CCE5C74|nr:GGDEF domain-containing protein [Bremerella volcania]UBM38396.1 GGDEF domain-containing protein [Bremerella volcania]